MPNTFIGHRERWMGLSEVDYLGQFVKAWMAFNAWYRSTYAERQDRKIINEFKWQPNTARNKLVPLLTRSDGEDADLFRADIGLLHYRLENFEINSGREDEKERITLSQVFLRDLPPFKKTDSHWNYTVTVDRAGPGKVETVVTNKGGTDVVRLNQTTYQIKDLDTFPAFASLPVSVRPKVRNLYQQAAPRQVEDLLKLNQRDAGEPPHIKCGSFQFPCGRQALFAGVAETIYQMRCTLFHGELEPTQQANECYEPAYRIVRRFLQCI